MLDPKKTALWRNHAERPGDDTRAALMLAYWPLVKEVAGSVRARLPSHVEEADLISAGLFGLLAAIERFDPDDASRFESFARARVRGAIIDDLRAHDWAPRHVRERARELRDTGSALEQKLHRRATQRELAAALGLTADQVHARLARNLLAQVAALDAELASEPLGEPVRLIDLIQDYEADDPALSLAAQELRQGIVDVITALGWRERRVLTLHYRHGMTLREIGDSLGVSESRVSQIHTQVMRHLRGSIHALLPGDAFPLRTVVEAAAAALEQLDAAEHQTAAQR